MCSEKAVAECDKKEIIKVEQEPRTWCERIQNSTSNTAPKQIKNYRECLWTMTEATEDHQS